MNHDDERRRAQIAGAITLLVHAVVLLIPITTKIVSDHNLQLVEAKGYFTGLIDLSGSPNGEPGIGIPGSGHEGGGATVTLKNSSQKQPPKNDSALKPSQLESHEQAKIKTTETFGPSNKEPKNANPAAIPSTSKNENFKEDSSVGKENPKVVSSEKGGAGSGSGNGIGSGTGSGSGKGEGNGEGSGSGSGDNPGPGSGPPRKGLGIGQGNVSLGPPPIYPKNAQNNGVTGKNRYHIAVNNDGRIKVTCLQSSGDSSLDNSSLRTLLNRWRYPSSEYAYYFEVEFAFHTDSSVAKVYFIKVGWEDGTP